MFMGGYPSEFFMRLVLEKGSFKDLRPTFWVYFSFMVIGFIGCLIFQLFLRSKNEKLFEYK